VNYARKKNPDPKLHGKQCFFFFQSLLLVSMLLAAAYIITPTLHMLHIILPHSLALCHQHCPTSQLLNAVIASNLFLDSFAVEAISVPLLAYYYGRLKFIILSAILVSAIMVSINVARL
jgi:hypothetical protein